MSLGHFAVWLIPMFVLVMAMPIGEFFLARWVQRQWGDYNVAPRRVTGPRRQAPGPGTDPPQSQP